MNLYFVISSFQPQSGCPETMNFVFASAAKQSSFKRRVCFTAFAMTGHRFVENATIPHQFESRTSYSDFGIYCSDHQDTLNSKARMLRLWALKIEPAGYLG